MERRRKEDSPLIAPNAEGNVWPQQVCPSYEARDGAPVDIQRCWFCNFADFHLDRPKSLDVGVCYWPRKILF